MTTSPTTSSSLRPSAAHLVHAWIPLVGSHVVTCCRAEKPNCRLRRRRQPLQAEPARPEGGFAPASQLCPLCGGTSEPPRRELSVELQRKLSRTAPMTQCDACVCLSTSVLCWNYMSRPGKTARQSLSPSLSSLILVSSGAALPTYLHGGKTYILPDYIAAAADRWTPCSSRPGYRWVKR